MSKFETVKKLTVELLGKHKDDWEKRYGEYIESMLNHREKAEDCFNQFKSINTFTYHLSISELKNKVNVFTYSVRFLGQEVATIRVKDNKTYITTDNTNTPSTTYDTKKDDDRFYCDIKLPKGTEWDSKQAKEFREFFKNCEKSKGKSVEHALESQLITELSKKSSKDKLLLGVQPIKITNTLRFAMKTPLTASGKEVKYSYQYGGGIDILARCNGNLTVIELKDEHNSKEPPKKALEQAIAYATFIYKLLRSDKTHAQQWYNFFGYGSTIPKDLKINVVVAMPKNPNGDSDKSFALQEIALDNNDKLILHYMYLDLDTNDKITGIDSSLEEIKTKTKTKTDTKPYIKIHRGTDQIGGTVTEIKSNKGRIFIDFGSQLQGAKDITTLNIDGLTQGNADSTLLLTHYHGDHIGEIHRVLDDVPVYIGGIAKDISITLCDTLIKANIEEKDKQELKRNVLYRSMEYTDKLPFNVQDIQITPYRVDHSAFDSYMFLIEIDDVKILHTGDFRFHGFQSNALWKTIEDIGGVDYLIAEGTTLSREHQTNPENILTQEKYTEQLKELFEKHKKVAVLCSSTNIDHLASVQQALPDNKIILCDKYQKSILDVVTKHQKDSTQELPDIYKFEDENIVLFNYSTDTPEQDEYCTLIRPGKQPGFITNNKNQDIYLVYSQWTGYLKGGSHPNGKIAELQELYGDRFIKLHTSGHVYKEDLQKMIEILNPKQGIIPIHTENPKAFDDIAGGRTVLDIEDNHEIQI